MGIFSIVKNLVIIIALIAGIIYGLPYVEKYFNTKNYSTIAKDTITGYAARNVVAPIAKSIAEKAAEIADEASGTPVIQNKIKTQFFTQIPNKPNKPNQNAPSTSRTNAASQSASGGNIESELQNSNESSENNPQNPANSTDNKKSECCSCA